MRLNEIGGMEVKGLKTGIGPGWLVCGIVAAVLGLFVGLQAVAAEEPDAAEEAEAATGDWPNGLCLLCHSTDGITAVVGEEERPVTPVNPEVFAASVHGGEKCVNCHVDQVTLPHDEGDKLLLEDAGNAGDAEFCGRCHEEAYEGYMLSVHGTSANLDDERGPACADCHGTAHEASPLAEWTEQERTDVCGGCHPGASANFLGAVSHEEPSPGFLPFAYFAEEFLVILTASALGFAIIHVELDMLRWLSRRLGPLFGGTSRDGD